MHRSLNKRKMDKNVAMSNCTPKQTGLDPAQSMGYPEINISVFVYFRLSPINLDQEGMHNRVDLEVGRGKQTYLYLHLSMDFNGSLISSEHLISFE